MAQQHGAAVAIGSRVRIRGLHRPGPRHLPPGIEADDADRVIAIVPPEDAAVLKTAPEKGPGSSPGVGTEEWWRIVPPEEADAARRFISEETPMARALLGYRAGDVVSVRAPGTPRGWPVTILAVDGIGF